MAYMYMVYGLSVSYWLLKHTAVDLLYVVSAIGSLPMETSITHGHG
jgi:hypothetical protein